MSHAKTNFPPQTFITFDKMKFFGIQKLTLLDFPGRVAATVFTGGCNFRCPFCHNSSLVVNPADTETVEEEEILSFLKKRRGILDGVCVTGGEPLLQPGIENFIKKVKQLGFDVKLDTNGSFPDKLERFVNTGLVSYVAMDIKNSPESYGKTIGVDDFDTHEIEQSADFLLSNKNTIPFEFRTTVVKELHTERDMQLIGERFAGAENYYLQGFVDSRDVIQTGLHACSISEMKRFREILAKYMGKVHIRGMNIEN